jgi:chloramphenicol 3-O-phosphotransferase
MTHWVVDAVIVVGGDWVWVVGVAVNVDSGDVE